MKNLNSQMKKAFKYFPQKIKLDWDKCKDILILEQNNSTS